MRAPASRNVPPIEEAVQERICELFEQDVSINQIAKRLGIAYGTMGNYVKKLDTK